ncbi:hypothetical protein IST4110_05672 [Burkholderia cenocepacia]|nr:hypothetical protein IST4110_05672 [Burkholderia cenocepacia]
MDQHVARPFETHVLDELGRRHADFLLEAPQEIALAHRGRLRGARNRDAVHALRAQPLRGHPDRRARTQFAERPHRLRIALLDRPHHVAGDLLRGAVAEVDAEHVERGGEHVGLAGLQFDRRGGAARGPARPHVDRRRRPSRGGERGQIHRVDDPARMPANVGQAPLQGVVPVDGRALAMKMKERERPAAVFVAERIGRDAHAGRRLQQSPAFGDVLQLVIRAVRMQAIRQIESFAEARGLGQRKPRTQIDNDPPLICCIHWPSPRLVRLLLIPSNCQAYIWFECVRQDGYPEI